MSFHVGQKVARFRNDPPGAEKCPPPFLDPSIGEPCTVTKLTHDGEGMLLAEYPVPDGAGWVCEFFRPVIERKTDIAIFTALLNPANHKHLAGA